MNNLASVILLLTVLQVTVPLGVRGEDSDMSNYIKVHSEKFLDQMTLHFDMSLNYLLTSYAFSGQGVERPGMAKLLKEGSDRHWNEGIGDLKKYLQRGGKTSMDETFRKSFAFQGSNTLQLLTQKEGTNFAASYLNQLETLVQNSMSSAQSLNFLHKKSMHKSDSGDEANTYDADIAHYLEEKIEDEITINRKFSNLYTSLKQMIDLGMAVHFFDESL